MVTRHDNSGHYSVLATITNDEIESYVKSIGLRFTRATPTSIKLVANYEIAMKLEQMGRHVVVTKLS